MSLARREFLKTVGLFGAFTFIKLHKLDLIEIFAQNADYWHIYWLNGSACSGCAVSFAQATDPDLVQLLTSLTVGDSGLPIALPDYMQVIHPASGRLALDFVDVWKTGSSTKKVLIVEGAVAGEGFCEVGGRSFRDLLIEAAQQADYVIAFGSCASYGGIPAAKGSVTGAMGVAEFLRSRGITKTVINLPRCPGHPDSLVLVLASLMIGEVTELDRHGRPTAFYGMNMHETRCPYRPYYDRGIFIQRPGEFPNGPAEEGCRYKIGCKGPVTNVDCALRKWNGHVSYCVEAGAPCIGCSEPEFPDGNMAPFYQELPGLPLVLGAPAETWGLVLVGATAAGIGAHSVKRVLTRMKKAKAAKKPPSSEVEEEAVTEEGTEAKVAEEPPPSEIEEEAVTEKETEG